MRCLILSFVMLSASSAWGQSASVPARASDIRTVLRIELIAGARGGLFAQDWGRAFAKLGHSIRIGSGTPNSRPEIDEKLVGKTRTVRVIGMIDEQGRARFLDATFSPRDTPRIRKWLEELSEYGKQGTPDGKPMWGLSKSQFASVYDSLAVKLDEPLTGRTLSEAFLLMKLPAKHPLRFTTEAREWLRKELAGEYRVGQEVKGLSKSAALAIILNDAGLGLKPLRTPSGSVDLSVAPLHTDEDVWPIGWELEDSRLKAAPKLFKIVPVDLDNVKLADLMTIVANHTGVPVMIDHYRIAGFGKDWNSLSVTIAPQKVTLSRALRKALVPNRLTHVLLTDELGQPFIWVTTADAAQRFGA